MQVRRIITVMSRERPGVSHDQNIEMFVEKRIQGNKKDIVQVPLCCPFASESIGDMLFPHEQSQWYRKQSQALQKVSMIFWESIVSWKPGTPFGFHHSGLIVRMWYPVSTGI